MKNSLLADRFIIQTQFISLFKTQFCWRNKKQSHVKILTLTKTQKSAPKN